MSWTCRLASRSFLRKYHAPDKARPSLSRTWASSSRGPSSSAPRASTPVVQANKCGANNGRITGLRTWSYCRSREVRTINVRTISSANLLGKESAIQLVNGNRLLSTLTTLNNVNDEASFNYDKNCGAHPNITIASNPTTLCSMHQTRDRSILRWNLSNQNMGSQPMMFSNVRFYSQSSRHYRSNENNNMSKNNSNKANPIIDHDTKNQNNNQSATSQKYETDTGEQSNNQPSEPSIHNISYLPPSLHPYAHLARLDKPIGTMLLLHPCLWSTALATMPLGSTTPDLSLCALFGAGSFIMRGAGCTINDMWDSQYDKKVQRTKSRPLASGDLTYPQAWKFLALQLSAGLGVLLSLPHIEQCFFWGAASLPLVATYPLMKRYTNYPQLALGMTFNWGAIMGWVAVRGEVDWSVVGPLYASGIAWTLVYDTLYAHQDKVDDARLGLKSTALTFGEKNTKPILTALAGVAWGGWMMAGYNCGFGELMEAPWYYVGVSGAASHLMWQIWSADLNCADNLAERFRSNNLVGWIVFGSCVTGNMMAG